MAARDPFRTLELGSDATAEDVRAARRRLAKRLHPDRGGDARHMQELNAAAAEALALIDGGGPADGRGTPTDPSSPDGPAGGASNRDARRGPAPSPASGAPDRRRSQQPDSQRGPSRLIEDVPSFVIEGLPDAAFTLLHATAPSVGTVLDADPPHVLDVQVADPMGCWCRLELLPEGAATAVNLYIGDIAGARDSSGRRTLTRSPIPEIDDVRDLWIDALNASAWPPSPSS